jgi:hypothetical protein
MSDPSKRFAVTVDLPDRYWNAQLLIEAESDDEATSLAETLIEDLQEYVPGADLQVSDVEPID